MQQQPQYHQQQQQLQQQQQQAQQLQHQQSSGHHYAPQQQQQFQQQFSVRHVGQHQPQLLQQQQQQPQQQHNPQQQQSQHMTEANVPQSSHVRVASANSNSTGLSSYLNNNSHQVHGHHHQQQQQLPQQSSAINLQSEAVRKIAHLKKSGLNSQSGTNMMAVKKQLSHGDISGFVHQAKHSQRIISQRQQNQQTSGTSATHIKHNSQQLAAQYQNSAANITNNGGGNHQHPSHSPEAHFINALNAQVSQPSVSKATGHHQRSKVQMSNVNFVQSHIQNTGQSKSSSQITMPQQVQHQASTHQQHQAQQLQQQHQAVNHTLPQNQTTNMPIQKRASPASGAGPSQHMMTGVHCSAENITTTSGSTNITKKHIKLSSQPQNGNHGISSSVLFASKVGSRGGSSSPMNQLQAQIQSQQNKSMVFNAQQQVKSSAQQKIKFLLRGKESGNGASNEPMGVEGFQSSLPKNQVVSSSHTNNKAINIASQRQLGLKLSKQKSPKTIYEIDNNTQATFGVDENIKENRQKNFQMVSPKELAQESPSIGEEINSAHKHPSLKPNISSNNLRGPLNFLQKSDLQAFPGLYQDRTPSMKIQIEDDSNQPNVGLQKKQISQKPRYKVASITPSGKQASFVAAPSVSQLSAMVDAQKQGHANSKSPVHIHYHNHIQVINSSDLKGANVVAAATPSKSPKQNVQIDSLQKPRISKQPSQANITTARVVTNRAGIDYNQQVLPISGQPKTIKIKQSGVQKIGGGNNGKFGLLSVTPRMVNTNNIQKSTTNLKTNLQVQTKHSLTNNQKGAVALGAHNVSPAGKAALALLGQGGRSAIDIGFADKLNRKLLDAQQNEKSQATVPGEADLNTLTDSVDGSKVTSEALKNLQPIQSTTPQKLQAVGNKKQYTTSVPPLKLNHQQDANLQVTAQASVNSSKPQQNTGRVSHRLKQTRRKQTGSDQNVYKHTASKVSSVGNSSKVKQGVGVGAGVLSSSGASSNSLTSLGLPGQGVGANGSNKSANSILINELSKYINIRTQHGQKRFQQHPQKQKKNPTSSTKRSSEQVVQEVGQDQEEILGNLRHFLYFLERKKIINITEVVQDKSKMNNLIQEIMKVDFKDFSKSSSQKFKKLRASSGSESNGSQNRSQFKARPRQGTPVNIKQPMQPQQHQSEAPTASHYQQENISYNSNQQQLGASQKLSGITPRQQNQQYPPATSQHNDPQSHQQQQYYPQQASSSDPHSSIEQQQHHQQITAAQNNDNSKIVHLRPRADSNGSSNANLPIHHHLNLHQQSNYLAQKEANLHMHQQQQQQIPSSRVMSSTGGGTNSNCSMVGQVTSNINQNSYNVAAGGGFHLTNQSSVMQMQQLQHNYSTSQYNTSNNYVSDSSNGAMVQNQIGDQLSKYSNHANTTSRNKIPQSDISGQGSSINTQNHNTKVGHQRMSSSNEQIATTASNVQSSSQSTNINGGGVGQQNYANYKAVAVTAKGASGHLQKHVRKGNSADQGSNNDHSSKKQFKISGLWDLANQKRGGGDSENTGHVRRVSEGQITNNHRTRRSGMKHESSSGKKQDSAGQNQRDKRRYKSRGGSADQGAQREVLRLSRGSSAKRTAKEIVDYVVIDEDRFRVNDSIMKERERLIRYNKLYVKKYKQLPPTTQEFYEFVELIGKGAFGQVTLGIHKLTGRQVAIKSINKSYMQDTYSKQKVMQEVYILKKIRHSNIIRLFEVFQSPKHFLLVMEYADGGDLLQFVKKRKHLDEDQAKRIFKQVLHGIAHCHCRSVLHRDIKLDNILMDDEGGIKICDFGVSRLITKNQSIQEQCGTPAYLAPEIIADRGYKGYYVDLWSLGVLLYAMLQGTVPFKAKSLEALLALIMKGKLDYPQQISDQATQLIQSMLKIEPEERISIANILRHPWLKTQDDLECDDEDDDHDFEMGISFRRQECNFNPLSMIGMSDGPLNTNRNNKMNNPEGESVAATEESNDEILLTEQETNPMHQIGNINVLDIENLFHVGPSDEPQEVEDSNNNRLKYDNYCAVTQDFGTHRIDEEALKVLEGFGYPRKLVIEALHSGELNHATTCYNLLVTQ